MGNAESYDDDVLFASYPPQTEPEVAFLADIARSGPVLELGVGTGRVAIPLAAQGLRVVGVECDEDMVRQLRAKPGGEAVEVVLGDMAAPPLTERFALVVATFGTLFALPDQGAQVRCFQSVAERLHDDGVFVVNALVPDPSRYQNNQRVTLAGLDGDRVVLNVALHDRAAQTIDSRQVVLAAQGTTIQPIRIRYSWPAELDLMARLAGLVLRDRFGGWGRDPYDADSVEHVSVYRLSG